MDAMIMRYELSHIYCRILVRACQRCNVGLRMLRASRNVQNYMVSKTKQEKDCHEQGPRPNKLNAML